MMRSRLGLKALGLCALVVGLMAVGASAAQAEVGSHWNVNGSAISSTLLPELKIQELENNDWTLLSMLTGKKVELLCTAAAAKNFRLTAGGNVDPGAKMSFAGCIFKWGGVVQKKCIPHSKGAAEGTIETESTHGEIQLSGGEGTVLILPDTGETVAIIILGLESEELNECAAGPKLKVSGKFSYKDCSNSFTSERITHLLVENPAQTDLWIENKTAEHKVTLDGSLVFALTGLSHLGLTWGGTPA